MSKFRLCYAVCCLIWANCGFFIGQVRTLQKYGWLANAAIYINLLIIFITMGVIAHSPPDYAILVLGSAGGVADPASITPDAQGNHPPVRHYGGLPNPKSLIGSINGLSQGVYAYGDAQLFVEFMAEMKRPRAFIKAMWSAQFFIYSVYMNYGLYVYPFQGQYSYNLSYQGVSPYGWQVAGNMLAVTSGLIAAGLYGNIGIKDFYANILMDLCRAPPLTNQKKMALGHHSADLLVHCLHRGGVDPKFLRFGICRRGTLRHPVLLLVPSPSGDWICHQERCNARRRGIRCCDWSLYSPRQRNQALVTLFPVVSRSV